MSNILLINKYYPSGLTEEKVLEYYMDNKETVLKECGDAYIIFYIVLENGQTVIKRRDTDGKYIKLDEKNYEKHVHKRVLSLWREHESFTNKWIFDLDFGPNIKENLKKDCVYDILGFYSNLYERGWTWNVSSYRITNTSTGYHVFLEMKRRNSSINNVRLAEEELKKYFEESNYIINRRNKYKAYNDIIIDLSPMYPRGSYVVPFSLNKNGLICEDVTLKFETYKREDSILK